MESYELQDVGKADGDRAARDCANYEPYPPAPSMVEQDQDGEEQHPTISRPPYPPRLNRISALIDPQEVPPNVYLRTQGGAEVTPSEYEEDPSRPRCMRERRENILARMISQRELPGHDHNDTSPLPSLPVPEPALTTRSFITTFPVPDQSTEEDGAAARAKQKFQEKKRETGSCWAACWNCFWNLDDDPTYPEPPQPNAPKRVRRYSQRLASTDSSRPFAKDL